MKNEEDQNKEEKKEKKQALHKITCNCFVFEYVYFKWKKKEERTPLAIYDEFPYELYLLGDWDVWIHNTSLTFDQFSLIYCYHDISNYHIS